MTNRAGAVAVPRARTEAHRSGDADEKQRRAPMWHVVLLNDDDHSFEYVIEMLGRLFGHGWLKGFRMAYAVHTEGRVVVATMPRERAELKRDQIQSYGADHRVPRCAGSMTATLEPAG